MWYITSDLRPGLVGGFGHTFYDIFSSYVIGMTYDIEHAHTKIQTNPVTSSQYFNPIECNVSPKWEELMNLGKDETLASAIEYRKVYIALTRRWCYLEKRVLDDFFAKFDRMENILFILTNNNRIFMWQFYQWCQNGLVSSILWSELRNKLKDRCSHKSTLRKNTIVIHVRKGDIGESSLFAWRVFKKLEKMIPCTNAIVVSYGTTKQSEELKERFQDEVTYEFNTDTIETFKIIMDAHILVTSSTMSKVGGYYADGIVIYSPLQHPFYYPNSQIYEDRWIVADKGGNFDEDKFKRVYANSL